MLAAIAPLHPIADVTARARHRWVALAAPGAIYVVLRAASVLLLAWMSARHGQPLDLHRWDGEWYVAVAEHGYGPGSDTNGDATGNPRPFVSMAFFPAYPWLVSMVAAVFGGHYWLAAVTVSTVAGVVGAYGVARLARHVTGSQRAALLAVVLFAAAPMSIVYSMAYAEALFCALAAWALVGVVERRWMLAGLCAAAAGLARPTAVAVVAVVAAVAAWEVVRSRANWTGAVAAFLPPISLVAYYAWVANATGSLVGYFGIQRDGWGLRFDGGAKTGKWILRVLTDHAWPFETVSVWALFAALALLVISARRMPWPLWAYGCLIVVLAVCTSGLMPAKLRELLPAFVLLFPLAASLARQRATTVVTLTAGYVFAGLWIGAYSLTVLPFSI